jgi:hypothetical protein
MQEPVFNETGQLGIVVRDLEATVRRYVDDYGIGPWKFAQIDLGDANNYREYGQPVERSNRSAVATVGQVMWELIEPLDEEGLGDPWTLRSRYLVALPSDAFDPLLMEDATLAPGRAHHYQAATRYSQHRPNSVVETIVNTGSFVEDEDIHGAEASDGSPCSR